MQTMKNKVGRNLTETWLGKSLIRVGQKVDEVWMAIGQLLVKSWSAFKAKEVGRKLDKTWTDFEGKKVQQGYKQVTTTLRTSICQGYANDMPEFLIHQMNVLNKTRLCAAHVMDAAKHCFMLIANILYR